jgi:hypothetical protein
MMISVGLDVGKKNDPAALAVLHTTGTRPDSHRPAWTCLEVGNLPLGTPYEQIAIRAVDLGRDFAAAGYPVVLTIDTTGIGDAVVELARAKDTELHIVAVTIGAGRVLTHTAPDDYTVGKHRLTDVLAVALQQGGLVLPDTAGGRLAGQQMARFVAVPTATGYHRHEASAGHDDLVLALELGVWTGDSLYDQVAGVGP